MSKGYDVDKGGNYDISFTVTDDELLLDRKGNSTVGISENRFPTIEETSIINSAFTSDGLIRETNSGSSTDGTLFSSRNGHFKIILFEHGLKSFSVLYLSLGIVAAAVYVSRLVVVAHDVSDATWTWIGLIKSLSSILVVILVLWYKLLLLNNSDYIERIVPESSFFFFTFIVISSAVSWIYFLLLELLNYQYYKNNCAVFTDLVLPLTQMLFVMVSVLAMSDLVFGKVKVTVPTLFYAVYKSAATLLFVNCVSSLIFLFFAKEGDYLQKYIGNDKRDIFCLNYTNKTEFVILMDKYGSYMQVFSLIFFISSIAILIQPMKQFFKVCSRMSEDATPLVTLNTDRDQDVTKQYSSLAIILACFLCFVGVIGIILDALKQGPEEDPINGSIAFVSLPIGVYVVAGSLSMYLLRLLYDNFPLKPRKYSNTMTFIIIWVSLMFHLIGCLKIIINSSHHLRDASNTHDDPSNTHKDPTWKHTLLHIMCIIQFSFTMIQSMLQAMVLDYLSRVDTNHRINQKVFNRICYPAIILLASNLGFFVTGWYTLSGNSSIQSYSDSYNLILWGILSTMSDPFMMIFRGYCVLILLKFIATIRCHYNPHAQN